MVNWKDAEEVKKYYAENYQKNKEKKQKQNKIWRENNPNKKKEYDMKYRIKNKIKIKILNSKYRNKNNEKIKINRVRDKEKIKNRWREWSLKNKIKIQKKARKYYINNKKCKCVVCGKAANTKYCSQKCHGIKNSGKGNYFWNGGTSHLPYDKNWNNKFKKSIRERDNNVCMYCGQPQIVFERLLSVHHINGNKKESTKFNCISLCDFCHQCVEKNKKMKMEYYQEFFYVMLKDRYKY